MKNLFKKLYKLFILCFKLGFSACFLGAFILGGCIYSYEGIDNRQVLYEYCPISYIEKSEANNHTRYSKLEPPKQDKYYYEIENYGISCFYDKDKELINMHVYLDIIEGILLDKTGKRLNRFFNYKNEA